MPLSVSASLTKTAGGADLYVPVTPATGGDVINGNLLVSGNISAGGSLTVVGATNLAGLSASGASSLAGNVSVGGQLTQSTTSTVPVSGAGTLSGTWNSTFTNVAGMRKTTWTLLNSPFVANSVLNIPINGGVASRVRLICVNNGNTQSRSIMGEWSISPASGVFTPGTAYYINFNMEANWLNSGTATPLGLTVQLSGGGGGLVGTICIIAEQDTFI